MNDNLILTIVATVVIALICLAAIVAVSVLTNRRQKNIQRGLEDETLTTDLEKTRHSAVVTPEVDRAQSRLETIVASSSLSVSPLAQRAVKGEPTKACYEHIALTRFTPSRRAGYVTSIILGIFAAIAFACTAFGAVVRSQSYSLRWGEEVYAVVPDSSMTTDAAGNHDYLVGQPAAYLRQYNGVRIDASVGIDEVEQYDVVAFYDADDNIVIHRVVNIYEGEDGLTYLQLRGDTNTASGAYEMAVGADRFIGVYTGFQNRLIGMGLAFAGSVPGLTAFAGLGVILVAWAIACGRLTKASTARTDELAHVMDSGLRNAYSRVRFEI